MNNDTRAPVTLNEEELRRAREAIAAIKAFRAQATRLTKATEFFDQLHYVDHSDRKDRIRKIKYFNQSALMLSRLAKHEFGLKLIATIDGYLSAIEAANPVLTYLTARYLLELLAITNFVVSELEAARATSLNDWIGRGERFLSVLYRAKYSTSDPYIATELRKLKFASSSLSPMNITEAVKRLAGTKFFPTAQKDYDFLSNFCHPNGSAGHLFYKSFRHTNHIVNSDGMTEMTAEPSETIILEYPSTLGGNSALRHTAEMMLSCVSWIDTLLNQMPLVPFDDGEVKTMTGGVLTRAAPIITPDGLKRQAGATKQIGRNSPCSCGSGKKYKLCCLG